MFLLKPLPDAMTDSSFYSLWHFDKFRDHKPSIQLLDHMKLSPEEKTAIVELYNNSFGTKWNGVFGPAFGGNMEMLKKFWNILNITPESLPLYDGRNGLEMCERLFGYIFAHLGCTTHTSINGLIFNHPYEFVYNLDMNILRNMETLNYDSYFFKSWNGRP
jgi:hypothetical protein